MRIFSSAVACLLLLLGRLPAAEDIFAPGATIKVEAEGTGLTLVALHETGSLATTKPTYERGMRFLLKTQQADGSWLVHSRSKPFQTYFESGFPHGKDQFISAAASAWATAALALACPPHAEARVSAPRQ